VLFDLEKAVVAHEFRCLALSRCPAEREGRCEQVSVIALGKRDALKRFGVRTAEMSWEMGLRKCVDVERLAAEWTGEEGEHGEMAVRGKRTQGRVGKQRPPTLLPPFFRYTDQPRHVRWDRVASARGERKG
jgi:hypothetical protein